MLKCLKLQIRNPKPILEELGRITTGLYNTANYERRQQWKETGKIPNYVDQYRSLKDNHLYKLLHSQVAQQTLKEVDKAYRSWYSLRKKDERTKPPRFRKPDTPKSIWFTPASFKVVNNKEIRLSVGNLRKDKPFEYIKVSFDSRYNIKELRVKMINVVFEDNKVFACLCCEFKEPELQESKGIIAIDLGINNLVALTDDQGHEEIISGGEILSHQRYFNKKVGQLQSRLDKPKSTKCIRRLKQKQSRQIKHKLHIVTKYLAEKAKQEKASIVIGDLNGLRKNKSKKKVVNEDGETKNKRQINKKAGQKIHSWSYATFASLLDYKCKERGVKLFKVSERYTSRRCFACSKVKRSNRVKRGLYKCSCGYQCNSDINGARNILANFTTKNVSLVSNNIRVVATGTSLSILRFQETGILAGRESA